MSSEPDTNCAANPKSDAESYVSVSATQTANRFQEALKAMRLDSCSGQELREFFDNRAALQTVRQWRYGRRNPPQWAVDLLRAKAARALAIARDVRAGTGPRGNLAALRKWRASQASKAR